MATNINVMERYTLPVLYNIVMERYTLPVLYNIVMERYTLPVLYNIEILVQLYYRTNYNIYIYCYILIGCTRANAQQRQSGTAYSKSLLAHQ